MKCPVCGDRRLEKVPRCPRCAGLARQAVPARAERVTTALLVLILVVGLVGVVALAARQQAGTPATAVQAKRPPVTRGSEPGSADDSQAARRDAQGDQSSDD